MCVLERRNVIGGAAVTEEIIPGKTRQVISECSISMGSWDLWL